MGHRICAMLHVLETLKILEVMSKTCSYLAPQLNVSVCNVRSFEIGVMVTMVSLPLSCSMC